MSRSDEGRDGGRRGAEQAAMRRAGREQAEVLDVRHAVLGEGSVGNRQVTPEEANELRKGAGHAGVDAAAVLDFTRSLADFAAAPDDPQLNEEEEEEIGAEVARDTAIAEEVDQGTEDPDPEEDKRREKKNKDRRKHLETDKKTAGMGGGDGPADPDASGAPVASARPEETIDGLPVVSVVPRKRNNVIGLDAILVAGRDGGVLPPYLRDRAHEVVQTRTSREFTRLFHALNLAPGLVAKAFVLKAMLVHRPSSAWVPFAEALAAAGVEQVTDAAPGPDAPDEPPDPATLADIRRFWDPVAMLGVDPDWGRCLDEESSQDAWSVPKWLHGVPCPALDLCVVAVELALQGVLAPDEPTDGGAGDALARAFESEGSVHPSLKRWLLRLTVDAQGRDDLLAARAAMMRARSEMAKPWRRPAQSAGQVWR